MITEEVLQGEEQVDVAAGLRAPSEGAASLHVFRHCLHNISLSLSL